LITRGRIRPVPDKAQRRNSLAAVRITLGRQHEIDRVTCRIHGSVQVRPVASDPDVRFVHPPGTIGMPEFATEALIQNRCIALDPAPDRDVIHRQATLHHHLLQVPVTQRIAQVPSDAKYYDHVLEVSPAEQHRPVLPHRITLAEPPQAVCNRSDATTQLPRTSRARWAVPRQRIRKPFGVDRG